jgi:DNA-binding NarL/FixJ family response regulator
VTPISDSKRAAARESVTRGRPGIKAVADPVRVLIADDQTLFRTGLARLLSEDPRVEVVGQARDGAEAIEQVLTHRPNVVLMDLQMPNVTGVEAMRRLRRESPGVQVLALSAFADKATVKEALASGAKGFVDKNITVEEILDRILRLAPGSRGKTMRARPKITPRELNVVKQVAAGLSNKQIARRLGISEKTVRNHLSRAFHKLGATNRTEAVMNAMRTGLLSA